MTSLAAISATVATVAMATATTQGVRAISS